MYDNNENRKVRGLRLKVLRQRAKMTQEKLGTVLGFKSPSASISQIESGKKGMTFEIGEKAAEVFGIPVSVLVYHERMVIDRNKSVNKNKNASRYDEVFDLGVLLTRTARLLTMFREMETGSYGISQIQFYILFILYALGGKATSNEISSYTARTANSISQLTKRMERSGLVKKYTTDASDKNHVVTRLTKKGRQLYLNLETRENAHKAISVLTLEQRKQLRSCLETLQNGVLSEIAKASNQIEWKKPPLPSELLARSRT